MRALFYTAALVLVVLLYSLKELGMAPDPALYAGLAHKIYLTGQAWRLSASDQLFPLFFEHPPFFFQWGAMLFGLFGVSEVVARSMALIPSVLGLWALLFFMAKAGHKKIAVLGVVLLCISGHFTKYVASPYLEAPLFLGVVLVYLACLQFLLQKWNFGSYCLLGLGAFLCTASKGVAGLGALLAFLFLVCPKSKKELRASTFLVLIFGFLFFVLPFLIWAAKSYSESPENWSFLRYWKEQVFRSALSNRGNPFHSQTGSRFYYVEVLVKNLPHLVLGNLFLVWLFFKKKRVLDSLERKILYANLVFVIVFFVPFSFVRFQLPHYLHPAYFALALNASMLFWKWESFSKIWNAAIFRKSSFHLFLTLSLLIPIAYFLFRPASLSQTSNRGQEFMTVQQEVIWAPPSAKLWVSFQDVDTYRMEAFSLWYFRGRHWGYLEKDLAPQAGDLLWDMRNSKVTRFESQK